MAHISEQNNNNHNNKTRNDFRRDLCVIIFYRFLQSALTYI